MGNGRGEEQTEWRGWGRGWDGTGVHVIGGVGTSLTGVGEGWEWEERSGCLMSHFFYLLT